MINSNIMIWKQGRSATVIITVALLLLNVGTVKSQDLLHPSLTGLADRAAIKELVDAYAHYADRRQPELQAALFVPDGEIEVYNGEPGKNKRAALIKGRKDLSAGFGILKQYDVTMHFNGQTTIVLKGDSATGETYCLAHHLWMEGKQRMLKVMGIRYYDRFKRINGKWFFTRRQLVFDWIDTRPSKP